MLRPTHLRAGALAALVLALAAGGCSSGDGGSGGGKGLVFGVVAPLSGPHAAAGREIVDGAKLAASDLNVRGGIIGQPVKVVAVDDRCTAAGGREAARKLAAEGRLAGVLGGVCTAATRATARAFGPLHIPFLVTGATSQSILDPDRAPSTYMLSGTPYQESLAVAHWIALVNRQRLAVVSEPKPADVFLVDKLSYITNPVPMLVSRQTVQVGQRDVSLVAKTVLVAKPDIVYWAGSPAGSGRLVKALRAAGYRGTYVASARSVSPAFLAAAGPKAAEGAYAVSPARPQDVLGAKAWTKAFTGAYHRPPGTNALQAYDGLRVLGQTVTQSGKVDHALNTRQFPGIDFQFHTFLGSVQFARDHTIQIDNHLILVVHKGRFETENDLRSSGG